MTCDTVATAKRQRDFATGHLRWLQESRASCSCVPGVLKANQFAAGIVPIFP